MSLPTSNDRHVNRPLSDMAVSYSQKKENFFADKLAPLHGSPTRSNSYFKFAKEYFFADGAKRRAPGADAPLAGYGISTDSFDTGEPWALAHAIDNQDIANQDGPLDAEADGMRLLMDQHMIRRDRAFATSCLAAGIWGADIQGVNSAESLGVSVRQWDDPDSTPLNDIAYYKRLRHKATGQDMNVLAVGAEVWDALMLHPDILARISGGSSTANPALVNQQLVAAILGLEEIVVMDSLVNTAAEGATFSGSYIGGKSALLMLRNPAPGPRTVTAVKTFTWEGYTGNRQGFVSYTTPKPPHATIVEVEQAFVHKVVAPDCGVYLYDLVP